MELFHRCHAPIASGFGLQWQRTALPRAGGIADQDAWTLQALDYLRMVHNAMLTDQPKRTATKKVAKTDDRE